MINQEFKTHLYSILFLVSLTVVFGSTVTAQQAPTAFKVAMIFPDAFEDSKTGIKSYVAALDGVETSFRKELDDLNASAARMRTLDAELGEIRKQAETANPAVPVNRSQLQATFNAKSDELERLGREYKFKQEDLKSRYQRRRQTVVEPIMLEIGKAMREFAKQRGYSMIFNAGRLQEMGLLVGLADDTKNVTPEFIAFFNSRPTVQAPK